MDKKPTVFFMCGMPCSGKSTFVDSSDMLGEWSYLISTDNTILTVCDIFGIKYSDQFKNLIGFAEAMADDHIKSAIEEGVDIFWDQTNLTKKSRARKMAKFDGTNYRKEIFFFSTPYDVILERMSKRGEYDIVVPIPVLERMLNTMEVPDDDEGWDAVHIIEYDPELEPKEIV